VAVTTGSCSAPTTRPGRPRTASRTSPASVSTTKPTTCSCTATPNASSAF